MSGALELGTVGLIAATACLGAYIYAFIWKPVGGRWLQIVGLISTLLSLVLLSFDLRVGSAVGAPLNRVAAEGFLVMAAVSQSFAALRRRRGERRSGRPIADMREIAANPLKV
ncbi:hypothetical protein [Phenylobacterium sp.]|uniref:hypothetical protein n=1 Tax=Phenylobacterium sp. TaxID=1871053 RepID=UPI002F4288BF